MKKNYFLLIVTFLASSALMAQTTQSINTDKSSVAWLAKKVTGQHDGHIAIKEGQVELSESGALVGGSFVIDMTTISVADIENENMNAKLVGHLNSADFFDVENHPTATLTITNVSYVDDGVDISGDLTIKGTTHPTSFVAEIKDNDEGVFHAKTSFNVDRTLYDVRYGSGKFFDNLGDKTIYDNFTLTIELLGQK